MKSLSFAALLTLCTTLAISSDGFAQDSATFAPPEPDNMEAMFNGEDLKGWNGDPQFWSVKDGLIRGETTAENKAKGNTFLIWEGAHPKNFELRLSFRCTAANNSGIQYRSKHITENASNEWVVRGYQHELRNENKFPNVSGFIYGEGLGRNRICLAGEQAVQEKDGKKISAELITQAEFEKLMKLDDWNEVIIIAKDNRIQHYLNDRLILDFTDHPDMVLGAGVIALQLHAGAPMWAEFKNVRIITMD